MEDLIQQHFFWKSWFVLAEEPPDAEKTQEISSKNTSTKVLGSKSKNDQNRPESERGACNLPDVATMRVVSQDPHQQSSKIRNILKISDQQKKSEGKRLLELGERCTAKL